MTYLVYQMEQGATCGTPHWQGYVHWRTSRDAIAYGSRHWSPRFSWRVARGSAEENRTYCSRTDKGPVLVPMVEFGVLPEQGKRTDLQELLQALQAGASDSSLYSEFGTTFLRNIRMVADARVMESALLHVDFAPKTIIWLQGPTLSGKSRLAYDVMLSRRSYWVSTEPRWYNGYHGQEAVLFEDWGPQEIEGNPNWAIGTTTLLRITDRYPMNVPCKVTVPCPWLPTLIIFTSNYTVNQVMAGNPRLPAFKRRLLEFPIAECNQAMLQYMLFCIPSRPSVLLPLAARAHTQWSPSAPSFRPLRCAPVGLPARSARASHDRRSASLAPQGLTNRTRLLYEIPMPGPVTVDIATRCKELS